MELTQTLNPTPIRANLAMNPETIRATLTLTLSQSDHFSNKCQALLGRNVVQKFEVPYTALFFITGSLKRDSPILKEASTGSTSQPRHEMAYQFELEMSAGCLAQSKTWRV